MLSKVLSCIVCEGVRLEEGGKATIFGFAGIAPDAKINLPSDLATDLCFLVATLGEGEAELTFEVADPSGALLAKPRDVHIDWEGSGKITNVALSLRDVDLLFEGEYSVVVRENQNEVYKSSFQASA